MFKPFMIFAPTIPPIVTRAIAATIINSVGIKFYLLLSLVDVFWDRNYFVTHTLCPIA